MTSAEDARRVRRAALSVGVFVGVASAVTIGAGVLILLTVILLTGHHEDPRTGHPIGPPPFQRGDRFVVDVDRILPWVLGLGAVGVVLLAAVGWFAARRASRPLADALRLQRNFVADASHELRTPLTALSSRVQIAQRRLARGEDIKDPLAALRRDTDAMAEVLNDLLLTAEGSNEVPEEPTVLGRAAADAIETLEPMAAEIEIRMAVTGDASLSVAVPSRTVIRMLVALIDNAVQHSPRGGVIEIGITPEAGGVAVRVTDHGGGIVGIDPGRVFERFARSGESGRRRGFGIGLSLVRDLAERYGGGARVERTSPAGTVFLLTLPSAGPPASPRSATPEGRGGRPGA